MTDTLTGAVDIGMISRKISTDEENQSAFWVAVTKDAVFPVVSAKNPVRPTLLPRVSARICSIKFSSQVRSRPGVTWSQAGCKRLSILHPFRFSRLRIPGPSFVGKVQADILTAAIGVTVNRLLLIRSAKTVRDRLHNLNSVSMQLVVNLWKVH